MIDRLARTWPGFGLILGPFAWATSTQLNYALVPFVCSSGLRAVIPIVAVVLALVSFAGAALSARGWQLMSATLAPETPQAGASRTLLSLLGIGAGVLFGIVVVMQGIAPAFLTGCEP